ncbi:MAG TPA: endonuclease/exonuclease/phosphatase family protein [Flavihumibacter sp.]|jgi:endonuclease/exonuclease/phosphatase family metal-dependent hydrolase
MKKIALLLSIALVQLFANAQDTIRVMSFNIRYNNPGDGEHAWPNRKEMAAQQIIDHKVDLLGVQEALNDQVEDLKRLLPGYAQIGVGRDDGKEKGEYTAIYYNTARLELLQSGNFWLSETPDIPGSKGWDAAITRMVTWAQFRDLQTGKKFWHFNTHYDHIGKEARRQSSHLFLSKIAEMAKKEPAVVTGDFNAGPLEEPIQILLNTKDKKHLINSYTVSKTTPTGPKGSFHGFKGAPRSDYPIDYIFLKGKWKVLNHQTIPEPVKGKYTSDHLPVLATLQL